MSAHSQSYLVCLSRLALPSIPIPHVCHHHNSPLSLAPSFSRSCPPPPLLCTCSRSRPHASACANTRDPCVCPPSFKTRFPKPRLTLSLPVPMRVFASLPVLHCRSVIPCTLAATGLLARLLCVIAIFSLVRARARKDAAAQSPAMHQHTAKLRCIECSLNSIVLFAKQFKKVGLLMP